MSGIEVAGLVLGAFPLLISAIEYSIKAKKYAGSLWKFRASYTKELALVSHCREIFHLHLQELLQPLLVVEIVDLAKYEQLLETPGGEGWRDKSVEDALAERLARTYPTYLGTLQELQQLTTELLEKTKTKDPEFKRLLDTAVQKNKAAQRRLSDKMDGLWESAAMQPRILQYVAGLSGREKLLEEVETYIKRLQDHLAAAVRVVKVSSGGGSAKLKAVPQAMQNFWIYANTVYRLIKRSLNCQCVRLHCARVWIDRPAMTQTSVNLLFWSDSDGSVNSWSGGLWNKRTVAIRKVEAGDRCSCTHHTPSIPCPATTATVVPIISVTDITGTDHGTENARPIQDLCATLSCTTTHCTCLGCLHDDQDGAQHHILPDAASSDVTFITLSEVLEQGYKPALPLVPRLRIAAMLAAAQLRYHNTLWRRGRWTLDDVGFPHDPASHGEYQYNSPCIFSHFNTAPDTQTLDQQQDESFWELGVLLLELGFGRKLGSHELWHDPQYPRDSRDPVMRKAVAQKWSEDLELEVPGDEYARAVNWCLQQAPKYTVDPVWRAEFAENVVAPLQIYSSQK